ncbi:hypothetical protein MTQ01_05550 [Streptomyces sp. XM4193]|uniref:hypothetical protein n=1 Tax=Streptomyces sp. XM4193 TaxID=2929782 RepID=UPI001FFB87E2|nr:hypothetical protein [Streptomyces sp. XM4193]MCK1795481.1 hypothetical protein [Streptomyces sp. XM4193]
MSDHQRAPRSVNPEDASKSANPRFEELLASCAAASAVSTPPDAPGAAAADETSDVPDLAEGVNRPRAA